MKKKTVFIGLSGGVDSAVSAALLKRQGYKVVGVFIRTWHPEFLECNEEEERRDAMRAAAHLDIPFLTFDFEKEYKKEVADYMIREYKAGRTPNPDVICNKEIKFGVFLKKALAMGADYVATGHYAQKFSPCQGGVPERQEGLRPLRPLGHLPFAGEENFYLQKGIDPAKDQSYFLWTLKQEQLSKILFPIGHLRKTEVRKLAKKFKIPVAEKKDSQGICFLGAVDLKDFLKHYIKSKKGKVVDEKGGEIGYHDGAVFFTLGERHGFTITKKNPTDGPYYIVGKDVEKNILVVSQNPHQTSPLLRGRQGGGELKDFSIILNSANWISKIPESNKKYYAQIRYHGEFFPCTIKCAKSNFAQVIFGKSILVASGQSCVLYDKDICLGGGVVI